MKKAVHVLEDDIDIGELIVFLLTEQGYDVVVFSNIASFRQHGGQLPDLLVIDVMLPDGNGLDICREWKADEATRYIPVLLMSAYEDYKHDAKASKADGFISKPFDIKTFLNEVARQLS
ncbi:response regulator transcription factor [Parapedobacter koreensis]|uniref:Response regulator receiver domain-containing protein n=1 Tax=Parapedobacter koreensis TaxID=332977 RepID=A0A1H7NZB2_9SPHI|nr:response regulator [Parapedobacter koreensis]SEL28716.1 Response regulator receiver domain-containing protein [Parapedobacter koreensis]